MSITDAVNLSWSLTCRFVRKKDHLDITYSLDKMARESNSSRFQWYDGSNLVKHLQSYCWIVNFFCPKLKLILLPVNVLFIYLFVYRELILLRLHWKMPFNWWNILWHWYDEVNSSIIWIDVNTFSGSEVNSNIRSSGLSCMQGKHPDDGDAVVLGIGKKSYFIRHRSATVLVPKVFSCHFISLHRISITTFFILLL